MGHDKKIKGSVTKGIRFSENEISRINFCVKTGDYISFSDFVRFATRRQIELENNDGQGR
ncbi:hypothetical protein Metlim_0421 [Methanoplanus limicola DSM 2279]|jgi:Arc/MetJ-type ribon-helix-helix transcriptional regulator|uniref:Uncharacterized protein n=1 Tax=Methanoplanus limicola DSM 2279 TaxID=937775 RepID=H1Z1N4_9EURY|nr:hypothetical protein Metlim_0421 [Methanoplanus limicola DSM 2279]